MPRAAVVIGLAVLLSACSGGGGGVAPTAPGKHGGGSGTPVDDWTTFAHDQRRTGLESNATGITSSTASQLSLAWTQPIDAPCGQSHTVVVDYASPLVVKGVVYVVSMCGNAYALNASDGSIKWGPVNVVSGAGQQCTYAENGIGPGCVRGTPTIDGNLMIVPVYGFQTGTCTYDTTTDTDSCTPNGQQQGGQLVALNIQTGQIEWSTTPLSAGVFRGEPLVLNGVIYQGVAGGDIPTGCTQGGVVAFSESNGAPEPIVFHTTTASGDGGSVWSAMSTDGTNIYAGTGNTCSGVTSTIETGVGVVDNEDSVVTLSPATLDETLSIPALNNFLTNNDVGSSEMLWENDLFFNGKNAVLYAYDLATRSLLWSVSLDAPDEYGSYGGPSTDGNVVVVSSGFTTPSTSMLEAFSLSSGSLLWEYPSQAGAIYGVAAFVPGVVFSPIDEHVYAFDDATGTVLWESPPTADYFYSSAAVVPSGLYVVDASGNVYCYRVPGSYPGTGAPESIRSTRSLRPLQHFQHHGVIWKDK
jgi:outer membrane protein assembly factor BamB